MSVLNYFTIYVYAFTINLDVSLRPIQTERIIHSRIGRFKARVKCAQIENSLSYCVNACHLRRSERAFSLEFKHGLHHVPRHKEGDERLYLPNCQTYLVIGPLELSLWHFIKTAAYHLGWRKSSSPSTKELHIKTKLLCSV